MPWPGIPWIMESRETCSGEKGRAPKNSFRILGLASNLPIKHERNEIFGFAKPIPPEFSAITDFADLLRKIFPRKKGLFAEISAKFRRNFADSA